MTNLKTIAAVSAVMAVIACGSLAFAQDDLDDLLKDLESDLAAEAVQPVSDEGEAEIAPEAEPAAEPEAEVEPEPVAEEPADEAPVAEEEPATEVEPEAEPEVEPVEEAEPVADETEPEAEPEEAAEPEAEVEPEAEPEVEPEEVAEPEAEPEVESEVEPAEAEEDVAADEEPAADEEVVPTEEPAEAEEEPVAEEPAVEEVTEEPEVADEDPAAAEEEPVPADEEPTPADDEEPAVEEDAVAEEEVVPADEPTEAEEEPVAEEPAVEEATEEPVAEEPATEEPAPAVAEEPAPITTEQIDDAVSLLSQIASEVTPEPVVADGGEPTAGAESEKPAPKAVEPVKPVDAGPDAELLANITATEKLRRSAYDAQAKREIVAARDALASGDNLEASKRYALALKLLNDSPATKKLRRECEQGIAESLYRAAIEEDRIGRRGNAIELMNRALSMRHPKARKQLEAWNNSEDPNANKKELEDIKHRRNDDEYKAQRARNQRHLKRARQLLAVKDIDRALDECELVLVNDPYNQEAIRLRNAIQKKRALILGQEFMVTRDAMIADVDRAWRPVYAPNARDIDEAASSTVKRAVGDDPERSVEQSIRQRMKEMILPNISFKPPATIIDVVDFFRAASKDFDRPDIPLEQRGFNFVLRTPETLFAQAAAPEPEDADDFSSTGDDEEAPVAQPGLPQIPRIVADNISFEEALKLVCESVDYKYTVDGSVVLVMPKSMSTAVMITRNYPVMAAFMEKMDTVSSEISELQGSSGFGRGGRSSRGGDDQEESKEERLKKVFTALGVDWPEGSTLFYMSATGKLRVKNTEDNLAELEKALVELNAEQKLIEIEARFVEVGQEDLNSLGFEWILNSDYTLSHSGGWLAKKLGVKDGGFVSTSSAGTSDGSTTSGGSMPSAGTTVAANGGTSGGKWVSPAPTGSTVTGPVGVSAMGGSGSEYGNGNRYLSTTGNHVSGGGNSNNDQFMRVNAFLGSADLSMILHMLSQRSDTDLLSAPKVLTRPNSPAVIKVVTEFIYPTSYDVQLTSSSSSGNSSSGSQSSVLAIVEPQQFETREVGVILDVTPTLTDDGNLIDIELTTQVVDEPTWKNYGMKIPFTGNSSLQNFQGIGDIFSGLAESITSIGTGISSELKKWIIESEVTAAENALQGLTASTSDNMTYYEAPMEQPFFHKREIKSSVSIYPGATIVMGGLITETRKAMDDKIPFLGDLPFIGRLFRSHAEQTVKKNLLIFVTTRLVDVRGREVSVAGNGDVSDAEIKAAPVAR